MSAAELVHLSFMLLVAYFACVEVCRSYTTYVTTTAVPDELPEPTRINMSEVDELYYMLVYVIYQ